VDLTILTVLVGKDRPGLIAKLTRALANQGVNIEELDQTVMRGVFVIALLLKPPRGTSFEQLKSKLEKEAESLGLNAVVYDVESKGWIDE